MQITGRRATSGGPGETNNLQLARLRLADSATRRPDHWSARRFAKTMTPAPGGQPPAIGASSCSSANSAARDTVRLFVRALVGPTPTNGLGDDNAAAAGRLLPATVRSSSSSGRRIRLRPAACDLTHSTGASGGRPAACVRRGSRPPVCWPPSDLLRPARRSRPSATYKRQPVAHGRRIQFLMSLRSPATCCARISHAPQPEPTFNGAGRASSPLDFKLEARSSKLSEAAGSLGRRWQQVAIESGETVSSLQLSDHLLRRRSRSLAGSVSSSPADSIHN